MSTSTWTGGAGSWDDPDNWNPVGVPGPNSDVTIATGDAVASASIGTVNSITDSSDLDFESAGTNTVTTSLDNSGSLHVDDNAGVGGTILNIGETLTNSHRLTIGNATLSASDEVTAASLDNTRKGSIVLTGSGANQALLDVSGAAGFGAPDVLRGYARLAGDSAIEFANGEITRLAASAHLGLVGSDAFIEDSTATGSNSALAGLASIGAGALFALHDEAKVSTTGALANDGTVVLDPGAGDGGSSLNIGGALTNSGNLGIGNTTLSASDKVTAASLDNTGSIHLRGSLANQALLDVTTGSAGFGTAGVLTGHVELAGDSAIEFASGQITSVAASNPGFSILVLNGNNAFIEDSTALGSNSALTGLALIDGDSWFGLENGAAVSTTGSLADDNYVELDGNAGEGGSSLTVGGTLTNSGYLTIGNASLSAPAEVTAASLDNTGTIELTGSGANQALLDVSGAAGFGAAGVLSGTVELAGDSAIEFATGQITSVAGSLELNGNDAFIEDSTALGSNSALTGLASIGVDSNFDLENGASLSTTGALASDGYVYLDRNAGDGGSSLTVGGTLTNSGSLTIGNSSLVSAAVLDNTSLISLTGHGANQTLLDVTADSAGFGAAGILSGYVQLNGDSAIEFASGQISTIAADATLYLHGKDAFVEDSTALGSNSALTGLANIAGSLDLLFGASVSTTSALVNDGTVVIDPNVFDGGSSLTVGGTLTNTGNLDIGNKRLASSVSVTANSFVNSGMVDLTSARTYLVALNVSGTTTNNGSISIARDTETLAGAVGGAAGSFSLSTANLQFDSSVSSGQTITETGKDALVLEQAQSFAATIKGFGTGDTIDATNFLAPPATTYNFVENIAGTGGTLMLTDTSLSLTAKIHLTGHYSNSSFTLAPDSGTGTLVKFV